MDLQQVRRVVVLARLLSFTKAAEMLGITQSALSRSIQAIESSSGVRLFDRDRGSVRVTQVGQAFIRRASAVLQQFDELNGFMQRSIAANEGRLSFGITPLAGKALLEPILRDLLGDAPELFLHVVVRHPRALLPLLISEEIDFFVAIEGSTDPIVPLKSAPLGWSPIGLLVRNGHPLLEHGSGARREDFPVIISGHFFQPSTIPAFYRSMLESYPRIISEGYDELEYVTRNTDAIWLTSLFSAWSPMLQGTLQEIVPPRPEDRWLARLMFYSADRRAPSPIAMQMLTLFRNRLRTLHRESADQLSHIAKD